MALNVFNGKRYIGVTKHSVDHRRRKHYQDARQKRPGCRLFFKAIRKYGENAFEWSILVDGLDYDRALAEEIRLISELKPEYNLTRGGQGMVGLVRTPEWRAKLSAAHKGRRPSDASIEGSRRSIAAGANDTPVVCLNDGNWFRSIKAASEFYRVSAGQIGEVCAGRQTRASGLSFQKSSTPMTTEERAECLEKLQARREAWVAKRAACRKKAVTCINTAERYDSVLAAAQSLGLSSMTVSNICRKGGQTKGGLRFRFADRAEIIRAPRSCAEIEAGRQSRVAKLKARRYSPETIERMRVAAKARGISDATREAADMVRIKPVRCVETGQVFAHAGDAALAVGLKRNSIYALLCRPGAKSGAGLSFEHVR